ncbi:MFS transporter [Pseudomonas sp. CCUG 57209]|uniref:MFS transporter n=1 Tax=Pseudomonas sivasensis TaxID=1880678 RepID=UPI000F060EF5|nr:MFS transporter [Pseudomonas sivasensis]MBA2928471.1 MFS transporter [Pseudomonas sivasensis]
MKTNSTLTAFYSIVTLFTGLDMAIVIAMVWFGLETTGSTFLVGATLCVATVVPYLCEQYIGKFFTIELSLKRLLYIRLAAFAAVLGLSFTQAALLPIGFLAIAFVVGVTDYFTISTLESKNTKLVLAGLTDSDTCARLMQTSIQIGAFGGALLGGLIVDVFSVNETLQIISLAAIVSLAGVYLVADSPSAHGTDQTAASTAAAPLDLPRNLYILIIVLSMIGFHIGAFNSLVPIVFQKLNEWNATLFGVASGLAGLGAFSAAVLPRIKLNSYGAITLVILADVAIVYFQNLYVMMAAAFLLGFCINSLRIQLRKTLIESAPNDRVADVIAAKSSLYYLLVSGSAPMILTFFTTSGFLGLEGARLLMIVSAGLLATAVLAWNLTPAASPAATTE